MGGGRLNPNHGPPHSSGNMKRGVGMEAWTLAATSIMDSVDAWLLLAIFTCANKQHTKIEASWNSTQKRLQNSDGHLRNLLLLS